MKHLRLLGSLLSGIVLSLVFASVAHAATFTVDDTGDASAVDPSVSCDTAGNVCTLRSAIEAANAQAGADTIDFNIAGGGVHTIVPQSPYNITEQVTIDGSTQPGASCGTLVPTNLPGSNTPHTLLIEIDGTDAIDNFYDGVIQLSDTAASSSLIKGLVVNNATTNVGFAIKFATNNVDNVTIECNYIGTNTDGTAAHANANGIGSNNGYDIVGLTIQNNLISGNTESNITIDGPDNPNNMVIQNNLIGTTASGEGAIAGTTGPSISLFQLNTVQISKNIISGNTGVGIRVSTSENISFLGNYVGLNTLGNPLGNGGDGAVFYGTIDTSIGNTSVANRNIISANTGSGIHIYRDCSSQNNSYNSTIFNNYIGTTTNGTVQTGYGNGGAGIEVNEYYGGCVSVYKHQIGGDNAGESNIIAGNTNQGILIHQAGSQDVFSISTIGNSIYGNGQFGIDLASDSDQDNGVADTDLGPNLLNNYLMSLPTNGYANYYLNRPTITSTSFSGNQLTVNYSYTANMADNVSLNQSDVVGYRLDFYLNDSSQDGAYVGYNQGKTHLGSFVVSGSEANATHTFTSPVTLSANQSVNATATVLWKNIPQSVCSNPDAYYGNGVPYNPCTPPQP